MSNLPTATVFLHIEQTFEGTRYSVFLLKFKHSTNVMIVRAPATSHFSVCSIDVSHSLADDSLHTVASESVRKQRMENSCDWFALSPSQGCSAKKVARVMA